MDDQAAMQLAIACAHTVEGRTGPRPPVGAVIRQNGEIIGQGATSLPYGPHAEIHALEQAGHAARGADLFVTLEPCCVSIHTPPCTNTIIKAGIGRVIVGTSDPNPLVNGHGIDQLRAAGIEVTVGIEAHEAQKLIRPFATFIKQKRPYVTAKWAMTLDGKLATWTGDAYWISGPAARVWVHNLRDRVDAIMIGSRTARRDNPQLTVRLAAEQRSYQRIPRQGPLRVILTTRGNLPDHLQLLQPDQTSPTCLIIGEHAERNQFLHLQERGLEVLPVALDTQGLIDFRCALQVLAQRGIAHVLLEGGAHLLGSAFDQSLIDHVAVFLAPKLVGGSAALSPLQGHGLATMQEALHLAQMHSQRIGDDILIEGEINHDESFSTLLG